MTNHSVRDCLQTIEVSVEDLQACANLDEEFRCIRKSFLKKALVCHPDKGGDAAVFRQVHASFEVLRGMYDGDRVGESFASCSHETDDRTWQSYEDMPVPSWDYYETAAEENFPTYRIEPAKTGRSSCKQKGTAKKCVDNSIAKGEIRIGAVDDMSGSYSYWKHLACWRVPSKVWLGLPNPETCTDTEPFSQALLSMNEVLLSGFSELSTEQQLLVVQHVMDKGNWARLVKPKKKKVKDAAMLTAESDGVDNSGSTVAKTSTDLVPQRERFVVPKPSVNGAIAGCLAGKTCVLTGIFPEVGGGRGLRLGCEKVKAMIESFGGRVTSGISGKTDILIVGKEPGASKIGKARGSEKCKMIGLKGLKEIIEGKSTIDDAAANLPPITNFSDGYTKGRAITAAAAGVDAIVPATESVVDKKPAAKDPKKPAKKSVKKPTAAKKAANKSGGKKATISKDDAEDDESGKKKRSKKEVKQAARKKQRKASKNATDEQEKENEAETIICDGCGVDCTERSWFVKTTGEDYCVDCYCADCEDGKCGVEQSHGVTV